MEGSASLTYCIGANTSHIRALGIQWHSSARFIPDSDLVGIHDCSLDEIDRAVTEPFESCKEAYTVEQMFEHLGIPLEFKAVTLQQNRGSHGYKNLEWAGAGLHYGTTILLPHKEDVKAVLLAKKLKQKAQKRVDSLISSIISEQEVKRRKAARPKRKRHDHETGGDDEEWTLEMEEKVQCDLCDMWRVVEGAQEKYPSGVAFECKQEGYTCYSNADRDRRSLPVQKLARRVSPPTPAGADDQAAFVALWEQMATEFIDVNIKTEAENSMWLARYVTRFKELHEPTKATLEQVLSEWKTIADWSKGLEDSAEFRTLHQTWRNIYLTFKCLAPGCRKRYATKQELITHTKNCHMDLYRSLSKRGPNSDK